jgi:para-nitrobenzyl esterase
MRKKFALLLFNLGIVPLFIYAQNGSEPIVASKHVAVVSTESGKVRGYISDGTYTYKGIPYAIAERFMPPVEVKSWDDVRFMGYYGPTCPLDFKPIAARGNGIGMFALKNDWGYPGENCQNLNIWTQGLMDGAKRPVMVWIHGGGYEYGSSHELPFYDGENLSKRGDIVVVSVNHRLNILGFLDLSHLGEAFRYSPNVGLLDLVASLKWIKENIAEFGGDPDNVTLFGQSGGGGKITALLNSPVAEGLFHRAIIQSGSYARSYVEQKHSRQVTDQVLRELNLSTDEADKLKDLPYELLLDAGKKAIAEVRKDAKSQGETIEGSIWGPIHDDYFLPHEMFGPEAMELCKDVSIMIGTTKSEFALWASARTGEDMEATKKVIQERYKEKTDLFMEAVKKAYPETAKASDYLAIDFMFRPGALRDANKLHKGGHSKMYMYLFAWESPVDDGSMKSMHCMELPFCFDNIHLAKEMTGGGQEAYELAEKVSELWISFTRTGIPQAEGMPEWPCYNPEDGATMIINVESEVRHHHDKVLMELGLSGPRF